MSAIIGICSSKFCLFVADRRMVNFRNGAINVTSDDTDKVFQLNENVVFGATGVFDEKEEFLTPFNCFSDFKNVTLDMALNAIRDYTVANFQIIKSCKARNYILGGKQDGQYYMCVAHYNSKTETFELNTCAPTDDDVKYQILLPLNAMPFENDIKSEMASIFDNTHTVDQLIIESVKLIAKIADIDFTVGKTMSNVIV